MNQRPYNKFLKNKEWLSQLPNIVEVDCIPRASTGNNIVIFVKDGFNQKDEVRERFKGHSVQFKTITPFNENLVSPVPVEIRKKFWIVKEDIDYTEMYEGDYDRASESDNYIEQYCITDEQRAWMDAHRFRLRDLYTGKYRIADEAIVYGFYRDWNEKLGVQWFNVEPVGQAMMDAIQSTLGPVVFG